MGSFFVHLQKDLLGAHFGDELFARGNIAVGKGMTESHITIADSGAQLIGEAHRSDGPFRNAVEFSSLGNAGLNLSRKRRIVVLSGWRELVDSKCAHSRSNVVRVDVKARIGLGSRAFAGALRAAQLAA